MELVHILAEQYSEEITSSEDELLGSINKETHAQHVQPHMLSGHVQGRLLAFLSKIIRPEYILEIGTFTGYSALCLAEGLQDNGKLHSIELRGEDFILSQKNIDNSIYKNKITLHQGNALEIIPTLKHRWDLVFIDADKINYINYFNLVLPQLSDNGIIIADNVLFHGQVLEEKIKGKNAQAIDAFNKYVAAEPSVEQVLLTVRDGLLLIKKKEQCENY